MNEYISIEKLYEVFVACKQKITTDTRKLEPGAIFFALKGDNFNANEFAEEAIKGGCAYAVVDDAKKANGKTIYLVKDVLHTLQDLAKYHRSKLKIPFIGITGSNAKTTHKELIHAVLSKKYHTYATKGNLNNHIGVPLTVLAITNEHQMAIIEMGANHQGEIAELCEIANPDYGIITNIGSAHLEGFGGVEGIKKGKGELYKHIRENKGKIFVNGDDPVLMEMSEGIDKIIYGGSTNFMIHGKMFMNSDFVEFKWAKANVEISANKQLVVTQMFGHYNFINLLCAVCIGDYFQVGEELINEALTQYVPEMNRSQVKKTNFNTLILDAYNANPSSMYLAITNFTQKKSSKKIFILGDMLELGEYSDDEHLKILELIPVNENDQVICVGPLFFQFQTKFPDVTFFKNTEDAAAYLEKQEFKNFDVLIKGSRGIKLEKLVAFL